MNRKAKKKSSEQASTGKGSERTKEQSAAKKEDLRDPAVIRAEEIRTEGSRETVEALVVAFVLALLFRAFIAEAFVIPTGSMAPTLMGAHKDVFCDQCDTNFPVGTSFERSGGLREVAVAGICPNCRHVNSLDLTSPAHQTFNGDRILVSKFAYTLSDPERWDVIVFKFPGNPKQNYIKRLVGLPNETLSVMHGDIYSRPLDSEPSKNEIVRKSPSKVLAMAHLVNDSSFQPDALIKSKYPSRWQPWRENTTSPPTDSWNVSRSDDGLSATISAADDELQWLRYFHRWPDQQQWDRAVDGADLTDVDPYSSGAVTDFYGYNSYAPVPSNLVYDRLPDENIVRQKNKLKALLLRAKSLVVGSDYQLNPSYEPGGSVQQFGTLNFSDTTQKYGDLGMHWVGDLIFESEVETAAGCKELAVELVEAGVKYRCIVDLSSGVATLSINKEGQPQAFDDGKTETKAETILRAGNRHQVTFSNCDDQLLLWIDGESIEFESPTTFVSQQFVSDEENYPHFSEKDPLDAAPVGIAVRGGKATVHQLKIHRDKYYIATKHSSQVMTDYDAQRMRQLLSNFRSDKEIQALFSQPSRWKESAGVWAARRTVSFDLQEGQFFPMGDNSPASLDARCWIGTKADGSLPNRFKKDAYRWSDAAYVPRDLMVGKALLVFWPHPWSQPVPMTPNFKRFKLIR